MKIKLESLKREQEKKIDEMKALKIKFLSSLEFKLNLVELVLYNYEK